MFIGRILKVGKLFAKLFGGIFPKLWGKIKGVFSSYGQSIWKNIKRIFTGIYNSTKSIFTNTYKFLANIWKIIRNSVVNLAKSLMNGVKNRFTSLYKSVSGISKNIRNFVTSSWRKTKDGVVKFVTNLKDGAVSRFKSMKKTLSNIGQAIKDATVGKFKGLFEGAKNWLNKLKSWIIAAKDGFKKVAKDLGNSVANGAINGLNAMIDGINWLSDKIMKKKLIKKKVPKLSTGTDANATVQTNANGELTRPTKAVVNDKGIGNAKGPNGHREIIQRRNGKFEQPTGRNKVVSLHRGDKVHNGIQSKALRPHLSTGTLPHLSLGSFAGDLVNNGKKKIKHGFHETLDTSKNLVEDCKKWAGDKVKSFSKAIGDVMNYVKNPMKLVDKTLKHFGVDFSNIKGAMGGTMSWAYNGLKNGVKDLVGKWLEDAQGGDGDAGWLLKHKILQTFGHYTGGLTFNGGRHYGIDFQMPTGTKIKALTDGLVTQAGPVTGGGGNQVTLKEPGGKWFQWYMHMSKVLAHKGDKVKAGDLLGLSGSTGNSTTPHLHIQRMKGYPSNETAVNPMKWLKSLGSSNKSAKKWKSDIQRAAKQMKVNLSGSELNDIIKLISTESSGNAGIVQQINDVNTGANRARGLLQYTPGTFGSYKVKGHGNIMNGYDQLLAFFNNSSWRGNLSAWKRRMAAGSTGWGPTGGRRFANGTNNTPPGLSKVFEKGGEIINFKGGDQVIPNDVSIAAIKETLRSNLFAKTQSAVYDGISRYADSIRENEKNKQNSNTIQTDNSAYYQQMIERQDQTISKLEQSVELLIELITSTKNIEQQPKGFGEPDVSQAQGRKARMKAYARGGGIV